MTTPLTPVDCDLTDFVFMPLDVRRLLTSETWVLGSGDQRAASMTLWLESWHQVPAGSVPNNDRMLAHLSQCKTWVKVREHALRGWVECEDGRLYHPVVCEKALEAWIEKLSNMLSGAAGNAKRWNVDIDLTAIRAQALTAVQMLKALAPRSRTLKKKIVAVILQGSRGESPPDRPPIADGHLEDRKGQGQGQGLNSVPDGTDAATASSAPDKSEKPKPDPEKQRLWREGKALLVADGLSMADAGKFIGKLAADYPEVVKDAVDATLKATPPEPKAYLVATCQRLAGERNTVQSDAADKTRAALDADTAHASDLSPEQRAERIAKARAAVAAVTSQTLTEKAPAMGEASHVDD